MKSHPSRQQEVSGALTAKGPEEGNSGGEGEGVESVRWPSGPGVVAGTLCTTMDC